MYYITVKDKDIAANVLLYPMDRVVVFERKRTSA